MIVSSVAGAATPSEGKPHWESHSWIPAVDVEAGRPAGVDGSIALCGRHHCKALSPHSGDHWVRAGPEPWWGSCVSGWADPVGVSGSEVG